MDIPYNNLHCVKKPQKKEDMSYEKAQKFLIDVLTVSVGVLVAFKIKEFLDRPKTVPPTKAQS